MANILERLRFDRLVCIVDCDRSVRVANPPDGKDGRKAVVGSLEAASFDNATIKSGWRYVSDPCRKRWSGTGRNLKLRLDRLVCRTGGGDASINDTPAFKGVIRSFPPKTPIRFILGTYFSYFSKDVDRSLHPLNFVIRAEYESGDATFKEDFPIDMWEQEGLTSLDKDYLAEFGRTFPDRFQSSMREIGRSLEQLSASPPKRRVRPKSWATWFEHSKPDDYDWN